MRKGLWIALGLILTMAAVLLPGNVGAVDSPLVSVNAEFSVVDRPGVTSIPSGSTVIHFDTGITEVRNQRNQVILRAKDGEAKKLVLPKETVSATYVYEVPSGSSVRDEDDGRITVSKDGVRILTVLDYKRMAEANFQRLVGGNLVNAGLNLQSMVMSAFQATLKPPVKNEKAPLYTYPYLDYWFGPHIENAYDSDVDNLDRFAADWEVPASPSSPYSQTVIYIFNAVEPDDESDILQPLIRYTYSGGWDGVAYYGIDGNYFPGSAIDVSAGDDVTGTMWYDEYYQKWGVLLFDNDTSQGSWIYADNLVIGQNAEIFCDLEGADGILTNGQMPGDTTFSSIEVQDSNSQTISVTWSEYVNGGWAANLAGLDVYAPSASTVYLYTAN